MHAVTDNRSCIYISGLRFDDMNLLTLRFRWRASLDSRKVRWDARWTLPYYRSYDAQRWTTEIQKAWLTFPKSMNQVFLDSTQMPIVRSVVTALGVICIRETLTLHSASTIMLGQRSSGSFAGMQGRERIKDLKVASLNTVNWKALMTRVPVVGWTPFLTDSGLLERKGCSKGSAIQLSAND